MERTLSSEEKIRRAEEIYARRRAGYTNRNVATVNVSEEKNYGLFKKMMLQIVICLLIYFIFYLIQNSNYIFSEDVINKTKEILSYDINIPEIFSNISETIGSWSSGIVDNSNQSENTITNTIPEETNITNGETNQVVNENAIGGADLDISDTQEIGEVVKEEETEEEQPKTDEEYIKLKYSFIKPVEGIVSSEFGLRDVDNPIVSKNHTGIDIAANTGTQIKAAMEGTVIVSSTVGDYGYHIKIKNGDVITLYGHCSKLYVNEGEQIQQGQLIAEVGSTGKSTGPHLHFEIIRGENYINPRDILEF